MYIKKKKMLLTRRLLNKSKIIRNGRAKKFALKRITSIS